MSELGISYTFMPFTLLADLFLKCDWLAESQPNLVKKNNGDKENNDGNN